MADAAEILHSKVQAEHLGICNTCLLNCYWQSCPTGGWWIHEWPNRLMETRYKADPRMTHDANPGWQPTEVETDVPGVG